MRFQGEEGRFAKWCARCLAQNGGEHSNAMLGHTYLY